MDTYRIYTCIDPEAQENQSAINMTFVKQATQDI